MASPIRHIALTMCLLFPHLCWSQAEGRASLEVFRTSEERVVLKFQCGFVSIDTTLHEGYSAVIAMGMPCGMMPAGHPDLPTMSTLVELPLGSRLELTTVAGESQDFPNKLPWAHPLVPATEPYTKTGTKPEPCPDKTIYSSDRWYRGGDSLAIEHLGTMGDREVYRVTVRPFSYNPVRCGLRLFQTLTAECILYSTAHPSPNIQTPEGFLIISRPHYRETLQPFVLWKRQEGYRVEEIYSTTHKRDSVKALISSHFQVATLLKPAPKYILIVGDVADIQSYIGTHHPSSLSHHTTDHPYAEHTGDMLPDAILGRWPVNDTSQLRIVIEKTLRYEQGIDLDTTALNRVLLVAGEEHAGIALTTTNGQVNYLKNEIKQQHPAIDTLCHYNPASASERDIITSEIGQGIGLLNYTAHCTVSGWTSPPLSIGNIEGTTQHQPLLYVNNCCRSNDFSGTGFGEQLLRTPQGGAIGVIGATNESLWAEDYYWAVGAKLPISTNPSYDPQNEGAFDRWIGRNPTLTTQGELLMAGNMAVTAFGSPSSYFYWEIYCLLGDPSLRPYIGTPRHAWATATDVRNGATRIPIQGTSGAMATLVQGDSLIGSATLDSNGQALITLTRCLDTRPLILTASGAGLITYIDTLTVETLLEWGTALRDIRVDDDTVWCTVENIGSQRIDSMRVVLSQNDALDTVIGASIADQTRRIDTLNPGAGISVALPVQVTTLGTNPLWQAELSTWRDTLDVAITLRHPLPTRYPTLSLHLLNPDGTSVRQLRPQRSYLIVAETSGNYDSLRLEAQCHPWGTRQSTLADTLDITTPDSLCHLRITGRIHLGRWTDLQQYWTTPGARVEGFETGLEAYPWQMAGRMDWTLDSTESHSGRYSLRSGTIDHEQVSDLLLEVTLPQNDTVSFWVKLSTEPQHDILTFSIDGERRLPVLFGQSDWYRYTYLLPAGRHTLCWRYQKDASVSEGRDCVWIDDISLPMAYWETAGDWPCTSSTLRLPPSPTHAPLFTLHPNPATGHTTLTSEVGMEVTVCDMTGRQVDRLHLVGGEPRLWRTDHLANGTYFLIGRSQSHCSHHKIIIKNR